MCRFRTTTSKKRSQIEMVTGSERNKWRLSGKYKI
jgi:hypothetical protein